MNQMIETIENIHDKDICMFKIGSFYHVYNKDCYILSYLFNYKIKQLGNNSKECGFPINSLPKVTALLEHKKINYLVLDNRNNYDVDSQGNFENLNTYDEILEKAKIIMSRRIRIENICNFLNENINRKDCNEILRRIEEIIDEG